MAVESKLLFHPEVMRQQVRSFTFPERLRSWQPKLRRWAGLFCCLLFTPAASEAAAATPPPAGVGFGAEVAGADGRGGKPDTRFSPYAPAADHLWNQLHRALFAREITNGGWRIHSTDPFLYRGGTFLLEGEAHQRPLKLLDQFTKGGGSRLIEDPLKRLVLQHDLWAAFDYGAWYPDEWVYHSSQEPAAVALRQQLARAIGLLLLNNREIAALPDNYALAVKAGQYPGAYDPKRADRPFLPADLFDPSGPWVRFQDDSGAPFAEEHFRGAGGRAMHVIFLRLPDGREATERYLSQLHSNSLPQFPTGTMVAMVRRALALDSSAKIRVTPLTELVQLRVYRRIPADPRANFNGDFGEQDVYEFTLDRPALLGGGHGLRPVRAEERAEFFACDGPDPFPSSGPDFRGVNEFAQPQLKTCIQCHQAPGISSVSSVRGALQRSGTARFRTFAWDVEVSVTVKAKVKRFDWGLLLGSLEQR